MAPDGAEKKVGRFMRISKNQTTNISILSLLVFFGLLSTACAQEPQSPIAPIDRSKAATGEEKKEVLELIALKFEGFDPNGRACNLYISAEEHSEISEGDHGHGLLIKVDYALHDEEILDTEGAFYRYNLRENKYFGTDDAGPNRLPALVSAKLTGDSVVFDPNQITEYERTGILEQLVRIDFQDFEIENYLLALEAVLEDNSKFAEKSSVLNALNRGIVKISHNDHYDAVSCTDFNLTSLEKVTFHLDAEHEH
jgi:hypothetical protein